MEEQKHVPDISTPANELSPVENEPSLQTAVSPHIAQLKAEPKPESKPSEAVNVPQAQQPASPYLTPRATKHSRITVTKRKGERLISPVVLIFIATIIISFALITGFSFIMQKFGRSNALQFTLQYSDGAVNSKKAETTEWKPLESYGLVDPGDQVDSWTSNQVILSLDEENSIRLAENTRIEFVNAEKTDAGYKGKIKLLKGRIWLQGDEKSAWNVDTPTVSVDFHGRSAEVFIQEDASVNLRAWTGGIIFAIKGSSEGNIELAEGEETNYSADKTLIKPHNFNRDSPDEWEAWNTQHKKTEKVAKDGEKPKQRAADNKNAKVPEVSFAGSAPEAGGNTKTSSEIIKQPGSNQQQANTRRTTYYPGTTQQTQAPLPSDVKQPPATAPPGGPVLPGSRQPSGTPPPEEPDDNSGQGGIPDYRLPEDIQTSAPGYDSSGKIHEHPPGWGGEDKDIFIKNNEEAQPYIREAREILRSNFGMNIPNTDIYMVSVEELDKAYNTDPIRPFVQTWGFQTTRNGRHIIYVKDGFSVEDFIPLISHEMAHAWQREYCPPGLSNQMIEGFATWIGYKVAGIKGYKAVQISNRFYGQTEYSGSLKKLLIIEKKIGEKKLIELVQRSRTISELKKLAGM